ncbi:MAG: hypothetical protein JWO38_2710 [Gemmataceae bacterium]|nr:hypothetical protein [Gemmataceae bacterium]
MRWHRSYRADARALPLADRHYNRQKPGTPQFVPPGRCVVLLTAAADALWVSSWPFAEYVKHGWPGAWVCSCFRNESADRASELNRQAVAATRFAWGDPPAVPSAVGPVGMVSFIDRTAVRPVRVRGERVWGWSWLKAGWEVIGETKSGLLALGLRPGRMPEPAPMADQVMAPEGSPGHQARAQARG